MTDRISTFSQTGTLIENNLRLQSEYSKGQIQISSGLKSQNYEGIADDAQRLLSLESDQKRLAAQTENAELVQTRINLMFDSLGTIIDFSLKFAADLTAAISDIVNNTTHVQNTAQQLLEQTQSSLNVEMAGRYLFSGSATRTTPININAVGFGGAVIPSAPDTGYYQGNNFVHDVEVDDNYSINYGITGDNAAIEKIIRAYDLVRTTPGSQATLLEAHEILSDGIDELSEERSALSQASSSIDDKMEDNKQELLLLQNMSSEINEVDIAAATVRLKEVEFQIEASYQVTTQLLRLSILDYIR